MRRVFCGALIAGVMAIATGAHGASVEIGRCEFGRIAAYENDNSVTGHTSVFVCYPVDPRLGTGPAL